MNCQNSIKAFSLMKAFCFKIAVYRFAAWRSGGFRSTYFQLSTNVY